MSAKEGISFGPNRVVVEIHRAMRSNIPMLSGSGGVEFHPITGEVICEPLRDEKGDIIYSTVVEVHEALNLITNAGLEAAKDRLFNTATAQTVAKYIALSCSAHSPAVGDTVLDGEITTGGLARAAATYNSGATGVCDLEHEFTASATHTDVQLMGLFDAASTGDLYFEATITACTLISGDKITAKWNPITLS